jgi:hypothetical protein
MSRRLESEHEGQIVSDGRNTFRIVNGQRVWESSPPPSLRAELLIEAERLRLSRQLRNESITTRLP